jgi:hypothetical protein
MSAAKNNCAREWQGFSMNQNLEEEKIRQLFLELREQDERRTPSFSAVLNNAQATSGEPIYTWRGWRVAAAMAALLILSGAAVFFLRQSLTTEQGIVSAKAEGYYFNISDWKSKSETTVTSIFLRRPQNLPVEKRERKVAYHRRIKQASQPPDTLISNWQSPTNFLVQTSGAQWLRTLPNLNESILEMKNLLPDGKNEW